MDVFDLAARITLDSSGFESGIGNAKNKMQGFVSDAGKFLGDIAKVSAAAVGAAATGAAAITKSSVGSYADYQQLTGGIETLFKGSSDVIKQYADEAYKTAGLSANDYMETATSFAASLISGLDGDTAEAARLTQMAITDMSDNANKMGSEMSSIQHAYDGFARGNFSMLDNLKLGYSGTQEEMFRLMQTAADLDETFAQTAEFSLDSKGHLEAEFADIVKAIHLVQEEMGITGTTAAEAADTVSGSVSTMKAAWENWLTGLGTEGADMSGLTQNLIDSFTTVKDNVEPVLRTIADNAVAVFKDLTNIDLAPTIDNIKQFAEKAETAISDLVTAFQGGGWSGLFDEFINQIDALTTLDLAGIVSKFQELSTAVEPLISSLVNGDFTGFIDNFKKLTGIDLSGVISKFQELSTAVEPVVSSLLSGDFTGFIDNFKNLTGIDIGPVVEAFGSIADVVDRLKTAGEEGGVSGVIDEIVRMIDSATGIDISPVVTAFGSLADVVGRLVKAGQEGGIGGVIDEIVGMIDSATGIDIGPVVGDIGKLADTFGRVAGIALENASQGIGSFLAHFKDSALAGMLETAADKISYLITILGQIASGGVAAASSVFKFLSQNIDAVTIAAVGFGTAIGAFALIANTSSIVAGFSSVIKGMSTALTTAKTAMAALNAVMAANPIGLIVALVAGLVAAFITAYQTSDEFRAKVDAAFAAVAEVAGNVVGAVKKFFTEDLPAAFTNAVKAVKEKVGEFIQAGKDLIEGLKNGIMEKVSGIINSVKEAAGKVIDAVKGVFGIHSPSRVFADIGRNLVLGLEKGFDSEIGAAQRKIADAMDFGTAHATVDFSSSAVGKSSTGMINSMMTSSAESGGVYNINLIADGRTLAQVVFDPLNGMAKQKGVAIGA